jgi:peptide/nickel transport system substrate-binding protein
MEGHQSDKPLQYTRDELLRRGALAGAGLVGAGALIRVGDAAAAVARPAAHAATPKRGGTIRVGVSGGGAKDTIDAHAATNQADFARVVQLFESLVARDPHFNLVNQLAESFETTNKARTWTIRLR